MPQAALTNAFVRCIRCDREAAASFEWVREDIGLWVLELDPGPGMTLSEQIAAIYGQLQRRSDELRNLREGSRDFTLHLTFALLAAVPIILPAALADLASDCGFNLEIYVNTL